MIRPRARRVAVAGLAGTCILMAGSLGCASSVHVVTSKSAVATPRAAGTRSPLPASTRQDPTPADNLSGSITPSRLVNNGRAVVVHVMVTHATPGGAVAWEFELNHATGASGHCMITSPYPCGLNVVSGDATANSAGVATFDVRWVPGRLYRMVKGGKPFDDSGFQIDAVDLRTFNPENSVTNGRTIAFELRVTTPPGAPPPGQWTSQ
ncbi:MAG TPA: hypothetical protein VGS19_12990 [Streptosporangiaceae bacterium]|nr:hypothetical protein [Streptosporangiaceae bacterium]